MRIDVFSIFPQMVDHIADQSVIGRGRSDGHLDIDTILDAGIAGCRMQIFAKGSKVGEIGLSETDSRFVGALFMPQYDIERLLSDRLAELGVVVERGFEFSSFQETGNDSVEVTMHDPDGGQVTASADWLIDCSGAHSLIRDQLEIESTVNDLAKGFWIADVIRGSPWGLLRALSTSVWVWQDAATLAASDWAFAL